LLLRQKIKKILKGYLKLKNKFRIETELKSEGKRKGMKKRKWKVQGGNTHIASQSEEVAKKKVKNFSFWF
jgi:hypothetical protein